MTREFRRHGFGRLPARRENQDWAEIVRQSFGDKPRPVSVYLRRDMIIEIVGVNFFQWHGPLFVPDEHRFPAETLQPFYHVIWVGDAATQQQ